MIICFISKTKSVSDFVQIKPCNVAVFVCRKLFFRAVRKRYGDFGICQRL